MKPWQRLLLLDTRPLEAMTAVEAILWGGWLVLPFSTFSSSPAFAYLDRWAPEAAWGCAALALGALQLVAIWLSLRNGEPLPRLRWPMAWLMVVLWSLTDGAFWVSSLPSTATVTYLVFSLAALWSALAIAGAPQSGR